MSRAKLQKGQQRIFLNRIAKYFNFDWSKIAKISNICERSLRDWRREKYNMSYKALLKLHNISNITIPIMSNDSRIYLHKKKEIDRYFKEIGTHNPKHLQKLKNYIAIRKS